MIKAAQLYKEELNKKLLETWYSPEYMYYSGWTGHELPNLLENNFDKHSFVSVDKDGQILGYISYGINYVNMSADRFGAVSFKRGSVIFARDLYKVICDIFYVYHMNRLSWQACVDNPAIRGYRNFIKRFGGRECAYYRQVTKLQDGKLHDELVFEILAEEFKAGGESE